MHAFHDAIQYADWSLFLLRVMVAVVFGTSGSITSSRLVNGQRASG